jgi:chemotaxis protein histidine kinase CheA
MLILSKATARDPNRRYRSAKSFLRDLRQFRFLTSPAKPIVHRALIVFLVVGVFLPALWELPLVRACAQMSPELLQNTTLPYPYTPLKPILLLTARSRHAAEERQLQIEREQEEKIRAEREERRRAEEDYSRKEEERQRKEEERRRLDEEKRRRAEEERKAEERRKEEELRKAEEQRRLAERQAEERRKAEERRLAAEREAEEKRKAQEEREQKEEELRQRLEREWRETLEKERKARTERIRQKAEHDKRERELLAREITGAIASLFRPASPLDAVKVSLSYAQVLGVACEYLDCFLDWANLNPDIHPEVWQYYLDRRPIPPPYDMLRPLLVSTNAPPYPYDVLDSYVKMFMLDESLGEVKTIDWSDWSDDEFETGTLRAHLLLPMHGRKRAHWNLPRRVILTGNPFLSVEQQIKKELEEKKTSEERNLDWQIHMRTPLADIIGEDSDD